MLQQTTQKVAEQPLDRVVVSLKPWAKSQNRFSLGSVAISGTAAAMLDADEIGLALSRHLVGDWGEVSDIEKLINDCCVEFGGKLKSAYLSACGSRYLVITDDARETTTVLAESNH